MSMKQPLTLLLAILIGSIVTWFAQFSFLVAPLLGVMMFFSFLQAKLSWEIFTEKKIYIIVLANIMIGWLAYFVVLPFGEELAFIAFLVGMIPTALAAPVLVSVLGGNVSFTLASVIVSNLTIGILFPFFSSLVSPQEVVVLDMLIRIILLLSIPFVFAQLIQRKFKKVEKCILKYSSWVFYLWATIIIIGVAKASEFVQNNFETSAYLILPIAGITALLCIMNFVVGYFIGGKNLSMESSQVLGQKNPMLMVWISLQFFSPLAALGPTFYILFHHLVNSWKLYKNGKTNKQINK